MRVQDDVCILADWRDYMVQWAFYGDHRRDESFQFSLALLSPGDTVIDVGANIGLWALPAASRVETVYALEPMPETFGRLEANVALNGTLNVVCERLGLTNQVGNEILYTAAPSNSGGAGLLRRPGAEKRVEVAMVTLDDFCGKRTIDHVAMLKVDVEGAERLVFQGAERTLGSPEAPAVFFELDGALTNALGWEPEAVIDTLRGFGYSIYRLRDGQLSSVETLGGHEDLFALKEPHLRMAAYCLGAPVTAPRSDL